MLTQVSIYAENRRGAFQAITGKLKKYNINILGSVTNDSAEYGIIRMVVDKPHEAVQILTEEGTLCKCSLVIGVELNDTPGALDELLLAMLESNIDIDYIYLCFNRENGRPILVMHTDDAQEVESCIRAKGFTTV